MKNYLTFLKKELLESVRTYKMFILLTVFLLLGIMNPLIAKLTPEIVEMAMPAGMDITVAAPTAMDSWLQFYKNVGQIGVFVMVLVLSGMLSTELSKGTLINLLTKGLSRSAVIFAKYTYMILMWTAGYVLAYLVTWGYTVFLFPKDAASNVLLSAFFLWVFGVFLLAVLMLSAVLTGNSYGGLLITGGVFVVCMLLNMVPAVHKFNPLTLGTDNMALIQNTVKAEEFFPAVGVAGVVVVLAIAGAVMLFRKKQL